MAKPSIIECRNCGKSNFKTYEDGSGYCLECNDTFASMNDYDINKKGSTTGKNEMTISKENNQSIVNKLIKPFKDSSILTNLFFLFGLIFLVSGIWYLILSRVNNVLSPFITILIICGILFFLTGISLNENEFRRAFYFSIVISLLLYILGMYGIFIDIIVNYTCLCPVSFLLFIVFSAFLFLIMDKKQREKS